MTTATEVGRTIALETLLDEATAIRCYIVALDMADDHERALTLIRQACAGGLDPLSTLLTLQHWKDAGTRQPWEPGIRGPAYMSVTAEQVRHISARVAGLLYEAGYQAGATAALRAGFDHGKAFNAYAQRRADEVRRYEDRYEEMNACLGRPPGWRYDGGPVSWETGMPVGVVRDVRA